MAMDGMKISDLKDGMICDGTYILKAAELKKTAAGKMYIDMTLLDDTGEVNAKKWDAREEEMTGLKLNRLYVVNSRVGIWQNFLQLTINSMKMGDEQTQGRISDFVPAAPFTPEEMLATVHAYIDRIGNKDMQRLLKAVYGQYEEKLKYYPAAKSLHHAIRGGYLYHIATMLKTAEAISGVYAELDMDLLYTGILMHDIMKLEELSSNELGIADYSREGQLLGHIEMGISLVDEKAKELGLDKDAMLLVKHMILSHHNKPEYGSSKSPMFLEAEILHYIDLIDARVYDFTLHYNTVMPGEFTERIWSLERRIYRPDY
ncbi:MAG: HD domain-containing protein [Clostridia bacterium]